MIGAKSLMKCLVAVAVLSLGGGVSAEPLDIEKPEAPIGSRIKQKRIFDRDGARMALNGYGRCIAAFRSERIEAFLLAPSDEMLDKVMEAPSSRTRCAMKDMISSYREYRGALSEGWYIRQFRKEPPGELLAADRTLPSQGEFVEAVLSVEEEMRPLAAVDEFARCVATTAPVEVDGLLRTSVDSSEERAALGGLSAYFSPCAFEGQTLQFDLDSLRLALAYALATRAAKSIHGAI